MNVRPRRVPWHIRFGGCVLAAAAAASWPVTPLHSQGGGPTVNAWLTTADASHLLAQQPSLSFAADSGTNPLTIDVDESTVYQTMDGFGASFTDSSAWLVYTKLSSSARQALMTRLFDRTAGIGLSYLRQPIGASDFALSHYTYDDMPPGQTDPTLAHFSIDHDRAYLLPVLQQALQVNPQLRILASPWSPPAWMKSNGSLIGGTLNASAEAPYANYFVKFLQAYQAAGVPIDRVTPQNEPLFTPDDYPGMYMASAQEGEFVANDLGPAIASAGLHTRIDVWDHNWEDPSYAPAIFADPTASSYAAGSAWHCYKGTLDAMTTVHDQYPGKEVLLTECSAGGWWEYGFAGDFARDMDMLVIGATRNWARAVIKWNVALDTNHGPHTGGCTDCTGLVTIDQAAGSVASYNVDYYALGHASKFVLPGARRIASNTFGSTSIEDVAFKNPDGSTVLVVFNGDTAASHSFKVRQSGQSFTYTLPAGSAVTLTWTGSAPPPPPSDGTSLALNRPAVASSSESSLYPARYAVDGSSTTRWSSAFSDPQWIYVDLGSRYALSKIVINWEAAFAVSYRLQVSDDAVTWNTFYSTTSGQGGTATISTTGGPTGRYLRLYCTQRTYVYGQQWGYSLWELQAFGVLAPTQPPPTSTNLALARPVVASSVENSTYRAANAVDGSTSTRWSSAFSDPQWIYVDLGSRYALSKIVINWEAAFAVAYRLQVSDDAATWTSFYSTTAGQGQTETVTPTGSPTGRYLRVYCTQRTYVYGQQWGYSIWELQVFGAPATTTPPPGSANLALNRPATASSVENANFPAKYAVDGSTSTRWSSAFSDPQWIEVDLGSRYTLSKIVINWEAAFAVAYQLQVSDDGVTWSTFYSTTSGQGQTETITPAGSPTGRYVRVYCTQRTYVYGQQWGYSIWELQVFGAPAATAASALGAAPPRPA